jgi:hypothetical protein
MNPERAAELGMAEGDWVYLETPKSAGKYLLKYRLQFLADMHPDVVAGPMDGGSPKSLSRSTAASTPISMPFCLLIRHMIRWSEFRRRGRSSVGLES